ncbi:MAG: imidazole glycerol phosphate synthase subunit HisF [Pandoraea sp.]|nr:imidazole glycerol phosphate synthase subunit HisF [Pandoraea sp.]
MMRARLIPVLLLDRDKRLVKTVKFGERTYIGDPFNIIRLFNEKEVDEVVLLDFEASLNGREPDYEKIREIASEAFMPMAYGGAVKTVEQAQRILAMGFEKIVLNSACFDNERFITDLAAAVGSQSVVISIDAKKNFFGRYQVSWCSGTKTRAMHPTQWAKTVVGLGAGEIFVNFVDRDGTGEGYDLDLIREIADTVAVPVVACGGAGSNRDLAAALGAGASAAAAGSMFVFHGKHRAVLISYPSPDEIDALRTRQTSA